MPQISALTRKVRSLQGRGGGYNLQQKLVQTDKQTHKQNPTETKKSCDLSFPFLPFPCASIRRRRPPPPPPLLICNSKILPNPNPQCGNTLDRSSFLFINSSSKNPKLSPIPKTTDLRKNTCPFSFSSSFSFFFSVCVSLYIYLSLCWSVGSWRWREKRKKL